MYDLLNCTPNEADNLLKEIPVSEFGLKQLATFAAGLKYKAKEDEKKISKLMSELKEIHSFFESKTRKMLHGKSKTKRKFDCASEVQSLQNVSM